MINVDNIENYYLREYIKANTLNKNINENDYIKYALKLCVDRLCFSMLDLPNQLKQFSIIMEQYKTKDNIIKYSYKTDRLNYGISEDKLGSEYSNIALRNKFNNKKDKNKYRYTIKDYINYKNILLELLNLDNDIVNNLYNSSYYRIQDDKIKPFVLYDMINDLRYNNEILSNNNDIKNIFNKANKVLPDNSFIYICDTPFVLHLCNLNNCLTVETTKNYLIKSQTKDEDHSIEDNILLNLSNLISNPICITKSNVENIYTLIIDNKSKNDNYIIIPISEYINDKKKIEINKINSLYGKRNLSYYLLKHEIIAYNEIKMNKLLMELGLQLPLCINKNLFIYDDSIIYSLENVKKNRQLIYNKNINGDNKMKEEFKVGVSKFENKVFVNNIDVYYKTYNYNIITEQNIPYLIKPKQDYENNERCLFYDFSDKISLQQYLKDNKLQVKDYVNIINNIKEMVDSIDNFLLNENSIVIDPEYIFIDKDNKLNFICLPIDNQYNFSFELSKLLIRMLRYSDVNDKETFTLSYRMFVESYKDGFTFNNLVKMINEYKNDTELPVKEIKEKSLINENNTKENNNEMGDDENVK